MILLLLIAATSAGGVSPLAAAFAPLTSCVGARRLIEGYCNELRSVEPNLEEVPLHESQKSIPSTATELWLDLRGTAIDPHAALLYLAGDLGDELASRAGEGSVVDRIIVSEDSEYAYSGNIDILFESKGDPFVRRVCQRDDVVGRVVSLEQGKIFDPIPALETVTAGGWIFVDTVDIKDEEERHEAVSNLVEFLSISSGPGMSLQLVGDVDEKGLGSIVACKSDEGAGGVALSCPTKKAILEAGAIVESLRSERSVISTESGILLHQENDRKESTDLERGSSSLKSAIVLPFDTGLWKTASLVVGDAT